MPFTFVHPAIVLPLNYINKKWISLTALITGSMMPDVEAFFRMESSKDFSHSIEGIWWFSLPVGLLFTFLFHNVVRNPVINHLPPRLQQKFARYKLFNWNARFLSNPLVVLICLFVGIGSHFFWDGFTHFRGFFIEDNPALQGNINIGSEDLEIPYLLQYINTAIGVGIIGYAVWQLRSDVTVRVRRKIVAFWVMIFFLTALMFYLRTATFDETYKTDDYIIAVIGAGIWSLFFISLLYKYKLSKGK